MAKASDVEPFPSIDSPPKPNGVARQESLESTGSPSQAQKSREMRARLRRKSSGLQGEPRGDATGPALATAFQESRDTRTEKPTGTERGRRSKRRRVKSLFRRWKSISLRHTWLNPLIVCLSVLAVYLANPSEANPVRPAIFLSYPIPRQLGEDRSKPLQYGKGLKDVLFVAYYTVFFSFTREFVMQRALRPLARRAGILSRGKQSRFMEQAYTALYFLIFGPFGLYVMYRSPVWYFNTTGMYESFPIKQHEALFKAYYLLQASYWAQQMIVLLLLLEKPRKDFKELVAHHIITLALIGLSYRFHFTYVGIAVYITHDVSDFFLATSKVLNYLDSPIVVPYFVVFLGSWAYLRHYINLQILGSLIPLPSPFPDHITVRLASIVNTIAIPLTAQLKTYAPRLLEQLSKLKIVDLIPGGRDGISSAQFANVGPYGVVWETEQYKCWISQWITFILIAALQSVNIFWFALIIRILYRIVITLGKEAEDTRSEADSDMEEEEERRKLIESEKHKATTPAVLVNGQPLTPPAD